MIRFEDIKERVESYHPEADFDLLRRAYVFSAMKHKNQLRKSGEGHLPDHFVVVLQLLLQRVLDILSLELRDHFDQMHLDHGILAVYPS